MLTLINADFDLGGLWMSFHNELVKLLPSLDKTNSSDSNRSYLRSFFSMVEGITYRTRQILLGRQAANAISLSLDQLIVLSETSIDIDTNGNTNKRTKYYDLKSMMLFTYKTYSECSNKLGLFNKYISDTRYKSFTESIKMRNIITHPKTLMDVFIKGDDIQIVLTAHDWFHEFTTEIFMGDLLQEE
jgi:hypothetical protein